MASKIFWKTGSSFVVFLMSLFLIGGMINHNLSFKEFGIMVIITLFIFIDIRFIHLWASFLLEEIC